jgi:5-methyltetrahydrofolate--homocysteine methyltransferase
LGNDLNVAKVFKDENRTEKIATLFGLRQQAESVHALASFNRYLLQDDTYSSIGDFIAPKSTGVKDYIGLFAVSTGFGAAELEKRYQEEHDDYSSILMKSLADRLVRKVWTCMNCCRQKHLQRCFTKK